MDHVSTGVTDAEFDAVEMSELRDLVARYEINEDFDLSQYIPPGPVARQFIADVHHQTTVIMGPIGSGKTTACAFKRIYVGGLAPVAWHPADKVPTRMCRWIVLRDSFRSTEKTVLESWKYWFPKTYPGSSWAGGNDRPVTQVLRFMGHDGVRIEAITEFAGLGEQSIETMMKGREYSGGWLNEFDTHAEFALEDMEQRVGRYPPKDMLLSVDELEDLSRDLGRRVISGQRLGLVIGDMNAPTLDNHAYKSMVVNINDTPDRKFYRQPGGRSAEAENRFKLEPDYYERIVRNQDESFIRRMIDNEFGYSRSGKPVYESWDRRKHVAGSEIGFDPDLELLIGIDTSQNTLNPAAVFGQIKAPGRIAFIDELTVEHGCGAARFAELLKQRLDERYAGARRIRMFVDPAAQYGADTEHGQLSAMDMISTVTGLPVLIPAGGSNELVMRLDAIKAELRGHLEADTHLLACPKRCPMLLEGFDGKFKYKRKAAAAGGGFQEDPEKTHPWSDVHDAAQYLVLGVRGRIGSLRAAAGDTRSDRRGGWGGGKRKSGFDVHRIGR